MHGGRAGKGGRRKVYLNWCDDEEHKGKAWKGARVRVEVLLRLFKC